MESRRRGLPPSPSLASHPAQRCCWRWRWWRAVAGGLKTVLHLGPVRTAGLDEEANALQHQLDEFVGDSVSDMNPRLSTEVVDARFDEFMGRILPAYWNLRRRAANEP